MAAAHGYCTTPNEWMFKKLVRSGKNFQRQRKWAQSQPPSADRLKMVASQK
jgi:hypothetical protein